LTGYDETNAAPEYLPQLFQEVYRSFADDILNDVECLFVVGLMARLSSWLLGEDSETWEARSLEFRKRYRQLAPKGLPATVFANRGAYGDYFARQVVVPGGF
jgi:hypothetical protein